ncbi:MAG: hypothetical protein ABI400_00910 [Lacisediminihabitans sp.]
MSLKVVEGGANLRVYLCLIPAKHTTLELGEAQERDVGRTDSGPYDVAAALWPTASQLRWATLSRSRQP